MVGILRLFLAKRSIVCSLYGAITVVTSQTTVAIAFGLLIVECLVPLVPCIGPGASTNETSMYRHEHLLTNLNTKKEQSALPTTPLFSKKILKFYWKHFKNKI